MLKDKFEAVKQNVTVNAVVTHVKKNKTTYLVGTGTFVAGGIFAYALKSRPQITNITNAFAPVNNNTPVFNNTANFGGRQHKIVQRVSDGKIWEKAKHAALEIAMEHGISEESARTRLSQHMHGRSDHLFNEQYRTIGLGAG